MSQPNYTITTTNYTGNSVITNQPYYNYNVTSSKNSTISYISGGTITSSGSPSNVLSTPLTNFISAINGGTIYFNNSQLLNYPSADNWNFWTSSNMSNGFLLFSLPKNTSGSAKQIIYTIVNNSGIVKSINSNGNIAVSYFYNSFTPVSVGAPPQTSITYTILNNDKSIAQSITTVLTPVNGHNLAVSLNIQNIPIGGSVIFTMIGSSDVSAYVLFNMQYFLITTPTMTISGANVVGAISTSNNSMTYENFQSLTCTATNFNMFSNSFGGSKSVSFYNASTLISSTQFGSNNQALITSLPVGSYSALCQFNDIINSVTNSINYLPASSSVLTFTITPTILNYLITVFNGIDIASSTVVVTNDPSVTPVGVKFNYNDTVTIQASLTGSNSQSILNTVGTMTVKYISSGVSPIILTLSGSLNVYSTTLSLSTLNSLKEYFIAPTFTPTTSLSSNYSLYINAPPNVLESVRINMLSPLYIYLTQLSYVYTESGILIAPYVSTSSSSGSPSSGYGSMSISYSGSPLTLVDGINFILPESVGSYQVVCNFTSTNSSYLSSSQTFTVIITQKLIVISSSLINTSGDTISTIAYNNYIQFDTYLSEFVSGTLTSYLGLTVIDSAESTSSGSNLQILGNLFSGLQFNLFGNKIPRIVFTPVNSNYQSVNLTLSTIHINESTSLPAFTSITTSISSIYYTSSFDLLANYSLFQDNSSTVLPMSGTITINNVDYISTIIYTSSITLSEELSTIVTGLTASALSLSAGNSYSLLITFTPTDSNIIPMSYTLPITISKTPIYATLSILDSLNSTFDDFISLNIALFDSNNVAVSQSGSVIFSLNSVALPSINFTGGIAVYSNVQIINYFLINPGTVIVSAVVTLTNQNFTQQSITPVSITVSATNVVLSSLSIGVNSNPVEFQSYNSNFYNNLTPLTIEETLYFSGTFQTINGNTVSDGTVQLINGNLLDSNNVYNDNTVLLSSTVNSIGNFSFSLQLTTDLMQNIEIRYVSVTGEQNFLTRYIGQDSSYLDTLIPGIYQSLNIQLLPFNNFSYSIGPSNGYSDYYNSEYQISIYPPSIPVGQSSLSITTEVHEANNYNLIYTNTIIITDLTPKVITFVPHIITSPGTFFATLYNSIIYINSIANSYELTYGTAINSSGPPVPGSFHGPNFPIQSTPSLAFINGTFGTIIDHNYTTSTSYTYGDLINISVIFVPLSGSAFNIPGVINVIRNNSSPLVHGGISGSTSTVTDSNNYLIALQTYSSGVVDSSLTKLSFSFTPDAENCYTSSQPFILNMVIAPFQLSSIMSNLYTYDSTILVDSVTSRISYDESLIFQFTSQDITTAGVGIEAGSEISGTFTYYYNKVSSPLTQLIDSDFVDSLTYVEGSTSLNGYYQRTVNAQKFSFGNYILTIIFTPSSYNYSSVTLTTNFSIAATNAYANTYLNFSALTTPVEANNTSETITYSSSTFPIYYEVDFINSSASNNEGTLQLYYYANSATTSTTLPLTSTIITTASSSSFNTNILPANIYNEFYIITSALNPSSPDYNLDIGNNILQLTVVPKMTITNDASYEFGSNNGSVLNVTFDTGYATGASTNVSGLVSFIFHNDTTGLNLSTGGLHIINNVASFSLKQFFSNNYIGQISIGDFTITATPSLSNYYSPSPATSQISILKNINTAFSVALSSNSFSFGTLLTVTPSFSSDVTLGQITYTVTNTNSTTISTNITNSLSAYQLNTIYNVGSYTLIASYVDSYGNFKSSSANSVSFEVTSAALGCTLSIGNNSNTYSSAINLSISINNFITDNTGSIIFTITNSVTNSVTTYTYPNFSGNSLSYTISDTSFILVGSYTISAAFTGSANFASFSSNNVSYIVNYLPVTATLSFVNSNTIITKTIQYGDSNLSFYINYSIPINDGTISYTLTSANIVNDVSIPSASYSTFTSSDSVSLSSPLNVDTYTLSSVYSNSSRYIISSISPLSYIVDLKQITISSVLSDSSIQYSPSGINLNITTNFIDIESPITLIDGTVTYTINGVLNETTTTISNQNSVSQLLTILLNPGLYTITVNYSDDSQYYTSSSTIVSFVVDKQIVTINGSISYNVNYGSTLILSATTSPALTTGSFNFDILNGNVQTYVGSYSGSAFETATISLPVGMYEVLAYYIGNTDYYKSEPTVIDIVVNSVNSNQVLGLESSIDANSNCIINSSALSYYLLNSYIIQVYSILNPFLSISFTISGSNIIILNTDLSYGENDLFITITSNENIITSESVSYINNIQSANSLIISSTQSSINYGDIYTVTVVSLAQTGTVSVYAIYNDISSGNLITQLLAFSNKISQSIDLSLPLYIPSASIYAVYSNGYNFVDITSNTITVSVTPANLLVSLTSSDNLSYNLSYNLYDLIPITVSILDTNSNPINQGTVSFYSCSSATIANNIINNNLSISAASQLANPISVYNGVATLSLLALLPLYHIIAIFNQSNNYVTTISPTYQLINCTKQDINTKYSNVTYTQNTVDSSIVFNVTINSLLSSSIIQNTGDVTINYGSDIITIPVFYSSNLISTASASFIYNPTNSVSIVYTNNKGFTGFLTGVLN